MTDTAAKLRKVARASVYGGWGAGEFAWLDGVADELEALRARVAELEAWKERRQKEGLAELQRMGQECEADGWRPIETAPKDGTPFMSFSRDAYDDPREGVLGYKSTPVIAMAWVPADNHPYPVDEHGDWHDWHCYEPTHWRPLPAPPTEGADND